jgi:hypothetical protein
VADLLIKKTAPGVATVTTTDPFSSLEVHRIDRSAWTASPAQPGIYLLYGFVEGEPAVYIGMSTTNIRDRVRQHHVTPRKNWFGVLFAIPLASPLLCPAIEAELIRLVEEAAVVSVVDNRTEEKRWLDAEDVHIAPALDGIIGALEMLLGSDIFTPQEETAEGVDKIEKPPKLAREYKGAAKQPTKREPDDPPEATHRYAGSSIRAWGRFEAAEPDTLFCVLAGSEWRQPNLDPGMVSHEHQVRVSKRQTPLIEEGTLDPDTMKFTRDHVFDNWSQAVGVVSGKGSYSGGYHWQLIEPADPHAMA